MPATDVRMGQLQTWNCGWTLQMGVAFNGVTTEASAETLTRRGSNKIKGKTSWRAKRPRLPSASQVHSCPHLRVVDGAGGRHSTPVFCQNGHVGGAKRGHFQLGRVIVAGWVVSPVVDQLPDVVSKGI